MVGDKDISGEPLSTSLRISRDLGVPTPPSQHDIARWMAGQRLDHPPGSTYAYSNFGYLLLGLVIEAVTGADATHWIREAILEPEGVEGADFQLGRSLREHRSQREPWYLDRRGAGTFSVYRPSELVPFPDGGWSQETLETPGGWIATACAYEKFLLGYRHDGARRQRGSRWDTSSNGELRGTRSVARHRPDGVSYVALVNQDYNTAGLDTLPVRDLDAALDAVSAWPTQGTTVYRRIVPLLASASDPLRQGFVRIVNRSADAGGLQIDAWDEAGTKRGPVRLEIAGHQTIHLNSDDLEAGNTAKGLSGATGPGAGELAPATHRHVALPHPGLCAYVRWLSDQHARSGRTHRSHPRCRHVQPGQQRQPEERTALDEPDRVGRDGDCRRRGRRREVPG